MLEMEEIGLDGELNVGSKEKASGMASRPLYTYQNG